MYISLIIVRYPKIFIPLAFVSMAIFRFPLFFNKKIKFWKLLGCGKNGTFDIYPDFQQWGLLCVWDSKEDFDNFQEKSIIQTYWRYFTNEKSVMLCQSYESHGLWDGKRPFENTVAHRNYQGKICVLTRASIRKRKLISFWKNVPKVNDSLANAKGFITAVGIGEIPFLKQATFSIWESLDDVKTFAYRQKAHSEVIKKTRTEDWYTEELFARFIPIESVGAIFDKKPKGF
jgi:hypothetical protein